MHKQTDKNKIGLILMKALNEELLSGDKFTELYIYKENSDGSKELYVKVEDFSPFTNRRYMSDSLLEALQSRTSLTFEQQTEFNCFKISRILTVR